MTTADRPLLLDLFCGEGGAGMGYQLAGFDVVGVDLDVKRVERYPFPSRIDNAVHVLVTLLNGGKIDFGQHVGDLWVSRWVGLSDFTAIHASPPCQGYSRGTVALPDRLDRYDRLIAVTRDLLVQTGLPYVIENVEDAAPELHNPMMLCGSEFNLSATDDDGTSLVLKRHRLFESNVWLTGAGGCLGHSKRTRRQVAGVYSGARRDKVEAREERHGGYVPPSLDVLRKLIGADWMSETGCFLSIPPAYSEHIGTQLIAHVTQEMSA